MNRKELEMGQPAFLLAQVGAHAAAKFAEKLGVLQLTPPDAGILRLLRKSPGISQQELSSLLQIHPSRLVAILDTLEKRELVERKLNPQDRRLYSLYLTEAGVLTLERIGQVAREHQDAFLSSISGEERRILAEILQRIADAHGLTRGVHPGYKRMGNAKPTDLKGS
jgi:DNA-binding MarR family transcriptional regulator